MFINEFHARFMSKAEKSRLFDALRRLSRLEMGSLLAAADATSGDPGWVEWPPLCFDGISARTA